MPDDRARSDGQPDARAAPPPARSAARGLSERGSPRASGEFLHAIFGGCEARRSSGAYHR